jgi:hypothetical protein
VRQYPFNQFVYVADDTGSRLPEIPIEGSEELLVLPAERALAQVAPHPLSCAGRQLPGRQNIEVKDVFFQMVHHCEVSAGTVCLRKRATQISFLIDRRNWSRARFTKYSSLLRYVYRYD